MSWDGMRRDAMRWDEMRWDGRVTAETTAFGQETRILKDGFGQAQSARETQSQKCRNCEEYDGRT